MSVNYLFGRPLIPSDFLERTVTLNFRDMIHLMPVVFELLKMVSYHFGKATRPKDPKVFGK